MRIISFPFFSLSGYQPELYSACSACEALHCSIPSRNWMWNHFLKITRQTSKQAFFLSLFATNQLFPLLVVITLHNCTAFFFLQLAFTFPDIKWCEKRIGEKNMTIWKTRHYFLQQEHFLFMFLFQLQTTVSLLILSFLSTSPFLSLV